MKNRLWHPDYTHVMVDLLRYATRGSAGFQGIKSEVGGKTRTTNDYVDGLVYGHYPSLVVPVLGWAVTIGWIHFQQPYIRPGK
ncbi:MAG: hypothetical protein IPI42_04850 [Saprospiraceae bacterium]|nr:hypothetical protein [Candidatus Parvibacillus calidus]